MRPVRVGHFAASTSPKQWGRAISCYRKNLQSEVHRLVGRSPSTDNSSIAGEGRSLTKASRLCNWRRWKNDPDDIGGSAFWYSPTRERRECFFSNDPGIEKDTSPESKEINLREDEVEPVREDIAKKALNAVPNLKETQESPELWYYLLSNANNWSDAQLERASKILETTARKHGLLYEKDVVAIDPNKDPVGALRTLQVAQSGREAKVRLEITQEFFRDPVLQMEIIRQLESTLRNCNRRDYYKKDEPVRHPNESEEVFKDTRVRFARNKIIRNALPQLMAHLAVKNSKALSGELGKSDMSEIVNLINDTTVDDSELESAWKILNEKNIRRITFKDETEFHDELVGLQTDLDFEPNLSDSEVKEMREHVNRLKQDLTLKLRGLASDLHQKTKDETFELLGGLRDDGDQKAAKEQIKKRDGELEQEHGVSVDEIIRVSSRRYNVCARADIQDAQSKPDFLDKAENLLEDLRKADDISLIELAKEDREKADKLVEYYGPTFDKASGLLQEDEGLYEQTKSVLGEEMADYLRDNVFIPKDKKSITREDLPENLKRLKQLADMVISGSIRITPNLVDEQKKEVLDYDLEDQRKSLISDLEKTKSAIETLADNSACSWLGIPEAVAKEYRYADDVLRHYIPASGEDRKETIKALNLISENVNKLSRLAEFINKGPQVQDDESIDSAGHMIFSNDRNNPVRILVNKNKFKEKQTRDDVIEHEWNHALVYMATMGTGLLMGIPKYKEVLDDVNKVPGGKKALAKAEKAWGLEKRKEKHLDFWLIANGINPDEATDEQNKQAEEFYMQKVAEEYVMHMTDMEEEKDKKGGSYDPGYDHELFGSSSRELWNLCNLKEGRAVSLASQNKSSTLSKANEQLVSSIVALDDDDGGGGDDDDSAPTTTPDIVTETSVKDQLDEIEWFLIRIDQFMEIPGLGQDADSERARRDARGAYERALHIYRHRQDPQDPSRIINYPEEDDWYRGVVKNIHENLKDYVKSLDGLVRDSRDLSGEPPRAKSLYEKLFFETRWLSLYDLKKLVTDAVEDVKRMYERKSQRNRNHLAGLIAKAIPDNDIVGLSYLGRLKYEITRHERDQEQEEVGVWEKAYEHLGPNQLLEKLKDIKSGSDKDRMKAIMNSLANFGRIDWEDERIWNALNKLGNFTIPPDICKFDRFTREEWLKKVIDDIWPHDTELYDKWMNTNNNSFKSKRDEYEAFADVRSNTKEMHNELAKQLKLYTLWAVRDKRQGPMPDDINPYKYEKVLHYAMERGKMTMEDKFFYLIQGIDCGLLPLERLNVLNAEMISGGFPFMDFFTSHNNTRQEIKYMAAQLRETNNFDSSDRYGPGQKTKVWLQLVVARDKDARFRAAKILGARGNEIDHEDIPMLCAMLNMSEMNELLKRHGGDRQRVTQEGLKNAYAGFGTVFRTYSQLAKLSEDPNSGIYFTEDDAVFFGKRMLSYILFDNMVPGEQLEGRPNLSWGQIESEKMPSGGDWRPRDFRNTNNSIVADILRGYNFPDIQIPEGDPVSMAEYVAGRRGDINLTPKRKKELISASRVFETIFLNKIKSNRGHLISTLSGFADNPDFINEGDTIQASDVALMRRLAAERRN